MGIPTTIFSSVALATAAVVAKASAETVELWVKSDNTEINGNSLGSLHEGAGINYVFLGTSSDSLSLDYDGSKSLTYASNGFSEDFSVDEKTVAVSVTGSKSTFTFDSDGTLLVDGSSKGFAACKNTNDPYSYSTSSYELMYYGSESAPSDCLSLTVVKKSAGSSSAAPSSAAPSSAAASSAAASVTASAAAAYVTTTAGTSFTTTTASCSTSASASASLSVPILEGGAAAGAAPAGFALAAGVAAMLI